MAGIEKGKWEGGEKRNVTRRESGMRDGEVGVYVSTWLSSAEG